MDSTADFVAGCIVAAILCICFVGDMVLNWILAVAAQNLGGLPVSEDLGLIATFAVFTITTLLPLTCA